MPTADQNTPDKDRDDIEVTAEASAAETKSDAGADVEQISDAGAEALAGSAVEGDALADETDADAGEDAATDGSSVMEEAEAEPEPPEYEVTYRTCGMELTLETNGDRFLNGDSLWRMGHIYERFLAANVFEPTGTMVDVGAGFGVFAIPFARLFPKWTVWCFEPDASACEALRRNVATLGLENLVIVNAAVVAEAASPDAAAAIASRDVAAIEAACTRAQFRQSDDKPGYVEFAEDDAPREGMTLRQFPAIGVDALMAAAPTSVKIIAPGQETAILAELGQLPLTHIVGEMWAPIPSQSIIRPAGGAEQVFLPLAGANLVLRQGQALPPRHPPGLDVVVALYNAAEYIEECVATIIDNSAEDVRAIVVNDGSTDESAAVVERAFAGNPRVVLLNKPNGGCASARNYGRQHSDAAHITFVDADDTVDPEFYPKLLELARYSGAEVVQGRFDTLHKTDEGFTDFRPTYEDRSFERYERLPFGANPYFVVPSADLMIGQPAIWRRVYRRDFLDNRNIWFPEHIRAFDDQIFQMLTLWYAANVYCRDDVSYHYRQHPGQDIKAGDERFFYSLEMFRLVIKRAISEGWNDMVPILQSFVNTVNWIHSGLRPDLKPKFLAGAAELWVYIEMALSREAFGPISERSLNAGDFVHHVAAKREQLRGFPVSYAWIYLDSWTMHPNIVRTRA